ncbi:MAG: DinB family protein [Limnochordales bacterium]|nr:DinB family protein [Limnochordales bacterium]
MDVQELLKQALTGGAGMIDRAVSDLTEEEAAQSPHGLAPIVWQVGHLAVSEARLVQQLLGVEVELPASYGDLFPFGSSGTGSFPPLAEVRENFTRVHQQLLKAAEGDLARAVDGGQLYSTAAGALMFADRHRWYHIGKIMTLRSLLGKPRLLG